MDKTRSIFYSLLLAGFAMFFSSPVQALDNCCCNNSWDVTAEFRVAYYHPSSDKVRRIYGCGWADYQLEISKGFNAFGYCDGLRVWAGVSGFSKKGHSIGFHDDTRLRLVPVSLGLKYFIPVWCNTDFYLGGAVCYSFLDIHDDSDYVKRHTHKQNWGGLIQSGLSYKFCDWGIVSVFADYFFQHFHFHDKVEHISTSNGSAYGISSHSGVVYRNNLDMSGYKIGVGLGVAF